ncbi:Uncharacterised protein [Actinomyces bovis]|uniref:Uncharacterized protein n=1 Tax=Actinomyces bovis TaxID=1658 RepID=A0ABY1VLN0_9ACTO|nr:Uncharacterised protein [Actinomyces bovis]VEG55220.1 Uncharacterised protein [Actinomyces israelii]
MDVPLSPAATARGGAAALAWRSGLDGAPHRRQIWLAHHLDGPAPSIGAGEPQFAKLRRPGAPAPDHRGQHLPGFELKCRGHELRRKLRPRHLRPAPEPPGSPQLACLRPAVLQPQPRAALPRQFGAELLRHR